jgi:hypothetical protein
MAVTPDLLLAPVGPITPLLFPGEGVNELTARVQQYLNNAAARPEVLAAPADRTDHMVTADALAVAFTDVYIRMSAQPMTLAVAEKGSHGYSNEQIRNMRDLAAKYRADFEALIILPGVTRPGITPGTRSVATSVQW